MRRHRAGYVARAGWLNWFRSRPVTSDVDVVFDDFASQEAAERALGDLLEQDIDARLSQTETGPVISVRADDAPKVPVILARYRGL